MVDAVVQSVIDKAANAIVEEGFSLFHIQKNIESVQETMTTLQSYLKDAESIKIDQNPAAKNLIINIRDLAQDAEDILDSYFARIEPDNSKGPLGFLKRNSRILIHCPTVRKINKDSEDIKSRADKFEKSKQESSNAGGIRGVDSDDAQVWNERRKFLLVGREPKKVVGRDDVFDLVERNMHHGNAKHCKIVTIVGPGGVGKTTVAKKIYQNLIMDDESSHRCKRAMVYVSPDPDADKILRDIAKQVGLSNDKMDEHLVKNLYLYLQGKRYVVFLDDVWNTKTWDQLKDALMINSEDGSRIIVTSRDAHVGGYIHETALYNGVESTIVNLDVLSQEYARQLFQGMISRDYEKEIKKPLKEIGEKIVEKCGGLPLAIDVVVGMLRGKQKTVPAWNEVLGKMSQIPENNCLKILSLSYKDLPPKLKPLFLYLGIFPENREINVSQLIPLWIAERFIPDDGNQDDYVEQRINELSYRNLVQVTGRKSDGRAKTCRLHSLVYDLCTRLAEENNYFCTRNNLKSSDVDPTKRRRVTTNTSELIKNAFQDVKIPKLRALFCFCRDEELFQFLKNNASDFQFLRLLIIEFGHGNVVKVPEEIANLSGLIYLKMIGNLSEIPQGIRRLKRLQTVEIRSNDIPDGVLKMKHVKHLFLSSSIVVKHKHSTNISCSMSRSAVDSQGVEVDLPSVESLDVDFGPNFSLSPNSVKKLTNLKRLGLHVSQRKMLEVVFPSGETVLPNLEALKLKIYVSFFFYYDENDQTPRLDFSGYQSLKKLILYFDDACDVSGNLMFPPNIVKISLTRVTEVDKHMDSLRKLSKLERLTLKRCKAEKLDFSAGDLGNFPQLQTLILKGTKLRELAIDDDGISKLDSFKYEPSPLSENAIIPDGLRRRNQILVQKYV